MTFVLQRESVSEEIFIQREILIGMIDIDERPTEQITDDRDRHEEQDA